MWRAKHINFFDASQNAWLWRTDVFEERDDGTVAYSRLNYYANFKEAIAMVKHFRLTLSRQQRDQ